MENASKDAKGLAAPCPTARAFFHRTDRSAGSGAHEITRNEWRPGRQDGSGAGVVAQPSAMFLRVPGALVVQVRTATPRAEEQLARVGLGRAPGPRSQLPGEARNPRRPGDHRCRVCLSGGLDGTGSPDRVHLRRESRRPAPAGRTPNPDFSSAKPTSAW